MKPASILNADMATLAGWLREGWRWWLDELSAMVPPSLRRARRGDGPLACYQADGAIEIVRGKQGSADQPCPTNLALPASLALMREVNLPAMSKADMRQYLALEAGRLFPLSDASLIVDAEAGRREAGASVTAMRMAALHRETILHALSAARAAGLEPARITLIDPPSPEQTTFDFAPQLRAEGILPPQSQQPLLWWSLVGFAFLLNISLLVWRDQQSVARLQAAVDAQAPAVAVYRAIAGRSASIEQAARTTLARRAQQNALGDLAATTSALPDSAWVQRYDWDGRSLRIAGYLRPPTDVVAALSKNERFTNVRPSAADVQADIPIGQPFDISADIVAGKP